jgi:hypothetical protein
MQSLMMTESRARPRRAALRAADSLWIVETVTYDKPNRDISSVSQIYIFTHFQIVPNFYFYIQIPFDFRFPICCFTVHRFTIDTLYTL